MAKIRTPGKGGTAGVEPNLPSADELIAKTYDAVDGFVMHAGVLAGSLRHTAFPGVGPAWNDHGPTFAMAFVAMAHLRLHLWPDVVEAAASVHGPDSETIRIGESMPATESWIACVDRYLCIPFRNALFAGRRHPIEPDLGVVLRDAESEREPGEAVAGDFHPRLYRETIAHLEANGLAAWGRRVLRMSDEWRRTEPLVAERAHRLLQFDGIEFERLRVQLGRERRAIVKGRALVKPIVTEKDVEAAHFDPEIAALDALAARKVWAIDELPAEIDADMLRCLDAREWVQARACSMVNMHKHPGDNTPSEVRRGGWCSPIRFPSLIGTWAHICAQRTRDARNHPYEVRISEEGEVALARMRRVSFNPGNGHADADLESRVDDDAMLSASDLSKRFVVPQEPLEGRLKRWRKKNVDSKDYIEDANARSRAPRFIYRLGAVRAIIEGLRASAIASGKRRAK